MATLADEILFGSPESVEYILNTHTDDVLDEFDEYGFPPLLEAAIANRPEMATLLLKRGARVNNADLTGRTALHWATYNDSEAMVQLLLEYGANPNLYTTAGQSALVYPLLRNRKRLLQILMQHKGNLHFAQDYINTKLLAHRYELTGRVDIVDPNGRFIEINLEGFYLEATLSIIYNSLKNYHKHFSGRLFRSLFPFVEKIIEGLELANKLLYFQHYARHSVEHLEKAKPLFKNDLLILPIAYKGHAISFIKYGNIIAKCDRGEYGREYGTVIIYQMHKPQALTDELLIKLLYQTNDKHFVHSGLNQILKLTPITQLPIPAQVTGNCSWANIEASIPTLLFILLAEDRHAITADIMLDCKEEALHFYKQWSDWDKNQALTHCVDTFKESSKPRQAAAAALLAHILFFRCRNHSTRDLRRADKIAAVLRNSDYSYVIRNYYDIFHKEARTKYGRDFNELLDLIGLPT